MNILASLESGARSTSHKSNLRIVKQCFPNILNEYITTTFHQGHFFLRQFFKSVLESVLPDFFFNSVKAWPLKNIDLVSLDKNGLPLLTPQKFKDCTLKKR